MTTPPIHSNGPVGPSATRPRPTRRLKEPLLLLAAALVVLITLFPLWWVFRTALSDSKQIFTHTGSLLPVGFTLNNFARVLGLLTPEQAIAAGGTGQPFYFFRALFNSVLVTAVVVAGQVFFSATAAYAFARLRFPGRSLVFTLFISALLVPGVVTLVPNFVFIKDLGWLNTYQGQIAPYFLMTPLAVFYLRQFFIGVPRELEEAAKLDGASTFGIFWRVVMPISRGALATISILTFISAWNNFLWPYLIAQDPKVQVLTAALATFRTQSPQGSPDWTGLMAGTSLSMLPPLLLLLIMGRQIVTSLQHSGGK
ncbi:carbohydrate ABC transporter permease (plasmid) [Deinococcus radiomollis]|uniref:carbohydrate ABC transporter permease n=1 Tax=Deinococcus radiomollis TaxID=468916 RepID=UPI003892CA2D